MNRIWRSSLLMVPKCTVSCIRHVSSSVQMFSPSKKIENIIKSGLEQPNGVLPEKDVYNLFEEVGINVPKWAFVPSNEVERTSEILNSAFPLNESGGRELLVAKTQLRGSKDGIIVTHKTDIGGIQFGVDVSHGMKVVEDLRNRFRGSDNILEGVLFVQQCKIPSQLGSEVLVSGYQEPTFGPCAVLGFGGAEVEYLKGIMKDSKAVDVFPFLWDENKILESLRHAPVVELLEGRVRGKKKLIELNDVYSLISRLGSIMKHYSSFNEGSSVVVEEVEINPVVPVDGKLLALDGVMRVREKRKGERLDITTKKPLYKMGSLMEPKSAFLAGVSSDEKNITSPGRVMLEKLKKYGLKNEDLFVIHPRMKEIMGVQCCKNVEEVALKRGEPVDLGFIAVPAQSAYNCAMDAINFNAANVIEIISGGFSEVSHGKQLEAGLTTKLQELDDCPKLRPLIHGPNTAGVLCRGKDYLFVRTGVDIESASEISRNWVLHSQGGGFHGAQFQASIMRKTLAANVVLLGNSLDISVVDSFEYFVRCREDVKVHCLYIEGLKPGEGVRLMTMIDEAKRKGHSVVVYKAGRSEAGRQATSGHTGAVAGDYETTIRQLERCGAIIAQSPAEALSIIVALTRFDFPQLAKQYSGQKFRVTGVSNSGVEVGIFSDHIEVNGGGAVEQKISERTRARLLKVFQAYKVTDLVDLKANIDLTFSIRDDESANMILRALMEDDEIFGVVFSVFPFFYRILADELHDSNSIYTFLKHAVDEFRGKKALFVSMQEGQKYDSFAEELLKIDVPTYRSMEEATRVMGKIVASL